MIKRIAKILLGFNLISLKYLFRLQAPSFARAAGRAFSAARNAPLPPAPAIPEVSLGDILGGRSAPIRVTVAAHEDGALPVDQAIVLLAILVAEQPASVLEIGTFMGHTSRLMAENLESAKIHTVDLPENFSPETDSDSPIPKDDFHLITRRSVGRDFKGRPCADRIQQHFADTFKWDFSNAGQPTFFFIDGSHTYEYCKNDSEKCWALCRGRGVFLWHDCDPRHPGVERLILEWRGLGRDIKRIVGTPIAYWKSF